MSGAGTEAAVRRILVALDAATYTRVSLELVAELGACLEAEVVGLFVEEVDLLRLAELPFVRQVSLPTGTSSRLDSTEMERELRTMAARARQDLARAAGQKQVQWSFRVVRGHLAGEALAAAEPADLLVVPAACRPLLRHPGPGTAVGEVLGRSPHSVLLLRPGSWLHRPVMVAHDGSTDADAALEIGARLAAGASGRMIVLLLAETLERARELEQRLLGNLRERGIATGWVHVPRPTLERLGSIASEFQAGVLVLAAAGPFMQTDEAGQILEGLDRPVLLVR